jgi:hypothetical protein
MEPKGSLSYSQEPATEPYPEPDESSPYFHPYFSKGHSNIHLRLGRPSGLFSGLPKKKMQAFFISPMRATCPDTLILLDFIFFLSFFLSFLGSTAQLRPWLPPQNPAEFLGGFSTIFFTG